MSTYKFLVKGAYFRGQEVRELSDSLTIGAEVKVKRDAENEYDEFACSVHYEDIHIGYVEKDVAWTVAALFDEDGHEEVPGKVVGRVEGARNTSWPEVELANV